MLTPPPEIKILPVLAKKTLKKRNWTYLVVRHFTKKLEFVLNILWMIVDPILITDIEMCFAELDPNQLTVKSFSGIKRWKNQKFDFKHTEHTEWKVSQIRTRENSVFRQFDFMKDFLKAVNVCIVQ